MVSIIIVNYKQKDLLLKCVESIHGKIKSYPFEVIIVNNSQEDDLSNIANEFIVRILKNENRGYSQANNLGSKHAKGKYLFFLNPDTIMQNDFLGDAIKVLHDQEIGAMGFRLFNADSTFQVSFGYEISILNEIKNKKLENLTWGKNCDELTRIEKIFSEIKNIDWVSGAAILIKKDIFDLVGGFDERYFLYMEDLDICKRISNKGFKIFFYPFSKIIHLKGENTKNDFKESSYYHSKESQLLYYTLHKSFFENLLIRVYLLLKFFFLSIVTLNKINFRIFILVLRSVPFLFGAAK